MGCRAMALLLLALAAAVAVPSSSATAGSRGAGTESSTEALSDAVFFPSPAHDQEKDPTDTTSTLMSARAASRGSSFRPEAYRVWGLKRDPSQSHGVPAHDQEEDTTGTISTLMSAGAASRESSFRPEAYWVWGLKRDPSQSHGVPAHDQEEDPTGTTSTLMSTGAASRESSFRPEAYWVWGLKRDPSESHGVPAHDQEEDPSGTTSTLMSAGAVSRESSLEPEAYAYPPSHGKRGHNPPHDGVAAQPNSFRPEAYWVWGLKRDPSQSHGVPAHDQEEDPTGTNPTLMSAGAASRESSLEPEAYPPWNMNRGHNPPHDGVARKPNSFRPEAYATDWGWGLKRDPSQSHAYVAETTTRARGHDDLHVATRMLFTRKSMVPGAVLPEGTKFAGNGFPDPRRFVFREDADAIPFSYKQVDTILRTFGIPRGSKKADQVAATLRTCEAESPDPHTCATSEQAELDFAASSLATRASELRAVVTVVHGKEDAARYRVAPNGVARVGKAGGGAMVPCHLMAYPYMVHYCHRAGSVEALRVELMGEGLGDGDGDGNAAAAASGATAIAVCHSNTTSWDARYFQMLNATRGEELCHFMPRNYVLWLPAAAL